MLPWAEVSSNARGPRIPVRIKILRKPKEYPLTAGMLCSVVIERNLNRPGFRGGHLV